MSAAIAVRRHAVLLVVAFQALSLASPSDSRAVEPWAVESVEPGVLGIGPAIAMDGNGVPHLAYGVGREPRFATRAGAGWVFESLLTPDNPAGSMADRATDSPLGTQLIWICFPALGLDRETGEPRVAWLQNWDYDVWYAQKAAGAWSYEALGGTGGAPSLAVAPAGDVHVSFFGEYGVRTNGTWVLEPMGVGPSGGSLALDASGRPGVAVTTGGPPRFAERGDSGWSSAEIEPSGSVWSASAAIDAAGRAHVAYVDETSQSVRYARREGTSWFVETVAGPVGEGSGVALALSANGQPFISYWDHLRSDQCFAYRQGGAWVAEIVDSAGYVGGPASDLAIDAAGRAHLVYADYSTNRVRYALRSGAVTGAGPELPGRGFAIAALGPNPLRGGELHLTLRLESGSRVSLALLDVAGRVVASRGPVELGPGRNPLRWSPGEVPSGLYFLRAHTDRGEERTTRLAVVR